MDIIKYFKYEHLPANLQAVSKPFYDMAQGIIFNCPRGEEKLLCLRKLLEARDCAVRAFVK